MNKIKNKLAISAAFAAPLATFAQESGGVSEPDMSVATTAFTSMANAVTGWVSAIAPYLAGFLGGCLVVTLIFVGYKWVTRGTKRV